MPLTIRVAAFVITLSILAADATPLSAQGPALGLLAAGKKHDAHVVDMDLPPIVKRIRVPLVRPRRVIRDDAGHLYVADWGAGTVLSVDEDGRGRAIASDLHEPAGLAVDSGGNLYVSEHAGGMSRSGRVLRITPDGDRSVYAEGFTGATDIAFDATGNLYVANFHDNSISRVTPMGSVEPYVTELPAPAALAFDPSGTLYVASSTSGSIFRVDGMGQATEVARGLQVPSDLAIDGDGHLVVANYGGTELSHVTPTGRVRRFATVPKGTIGHFFEPDGNLLLVNWDHHTLMKVITILTVPCPDCDTPLRIRLRPAQPRRKPSTEDDPII